ncbi:bifunctional DNA primase/helicase [Pectobacterium carotovorum]|uniref:toprim domain-containing protein n=1 Tax=Pectobacterium carotovorum TaxID=554 RepID=UPI00191EFD14|nr:toprim domain-containing protein [Pectobacterium carotovorum]MBL0866743.1 bifunctional DNA primase/helicase [Pectobacterium carotovorum]
MNMSLVATVEKFRAAMLEQGIEVCGQIVADGTLHRYHVEGDARGSRNAWAILHFDEKPAGMFGCNKRHGDHKFQWQSSLQTEPMSPEEKKAYAERVARERAEKDAAARAKHEAAATAANTLWEACQDAPDDHPYLKSKGVKAHGLRVGKWEKVNQDTGEVRLISDNALLVPIANVSRNIQSLQAIFPSKLKAMGDRNKDYFLDGAKHGLFHTIGRKPLAHNGKPVFVLAEGYATGASIHEATGHLVLVCFDAGNLVSVANLMQASEAKKKSDPKNPDFPGYCIAVAADNDRWTTKPVENPGVHFAEKAAKAVNGILVVPEFQTLGGEPTDFNDLFMREGAQAVRDAFELALNPPVVEAEPESVAELPVEQTQKTAPANENAAIQSSTDDDGIDDSGFTVVGYDRDRTFIYHHGRGQVRSYKTNEFTDNALVELAHPNWWETHFAGEKGGINKKMALSWLFNQAQKSGIYDPECVRGRGGWLDQGRLVVHLGDRLLVDGTITPLNKIASRFVYERAKALGDISESAISDAEGQKILDTARLFRWERVVSADLLCGWLFLAPICGALNWRPHVWITGGAGSGKTSVMDKFVRILMPQGSPLFANGDSSEAGLRQALGSEARPLLIDETEADTQKAKDKFEQVIGLLRQSSSETVAKTYRGTVSGSHQAFALRAMACLSSIGVSLEQAQDIERVEVLHLRPKTDRVNDTPWEILSRHLRELAADMHIGDRMMRRAIDMADTINTAIEVFSRAAAVTLESQRNGDQIGALIAGAWCLQNSTAPTFEDAERVISEIDWTERKTTHVEEEVSLIATLVATPVNVGGGMRMAIGDLIEYAAGMSDCEAMTWKNANHQLQMFGIKVFPVDGVVKFHTANRELLALMEGTKFSTGFHDRMRRIDGSDAMSGKPFRIGKASRNGVAIPLRALIDVDDNQLPI